MENRQSIENRETNYRGHSNCRWKAGLKDPIRIEIFLSPETIFLFIYKYSLVITLNTSNVSHIGYYTILF